MIYGFYVPWMASERDKQIQSAAVGIYESIREHHHQTHGKLCNIKPKKSKRSKNK